MTSIATTAPSKSALNEGTPWSEMPLWFHAATFVYFATNVLNGWAIWYMRAPVVPALLGTFGLIGGVIIVSGVIGGCIGGRTDRSDRNHRWTCGVPGLARTTTLPGRPANCVRQLSVASR